MLKNNRHYFCQKK